MHKISCDNNKAEKDPIKPHRYVKSVPDKNKVPPDMILFTPICLYSLNPPNKPLSVFANDRVIIITPKYLKGSVSRGSSTKMAKFSAKINRTMHNRLLKLSDIFKQEYTMLFTFSAHLLISSAMNFVDEYANPKDAKPAI